MTPEETAIHKCRPDLLQLLCSGAIGLTWFISELVSNDFIDGVETNVMGVSDAAMINKVLEAVQVQVRLDCTKFDTFLSILTKKPALRHIVQSLTTARCSAGTANGPPPPPRVTDPLDNPPTLAELTTLERPAGGKGPGGKGGSLNIIEILTPKWNTFACALDFDDKGDKIGLIEANNSKAIDRCQEMLQRWLKGESRSVPVTWRGLIKTMEDLGYKAHASDVEGIISSRPTNN